MPVPINYFIAIYPKFVKLFLSGPKLWSDFTKLSISKYKVLPRLVKLKLDWKWGRTEGHSYFLCPSSSSSGPEPLTLLSSKEGSPFYTSEEEAVAGYYTADSYQYQDTEL